MHDSSIACGREAFEQSIHSPTLPRSKKELMYAHASFLQWASALIATKQADWVSTPSLGSVFDASPDVSRCFGFDEETDYLLLSEGLEWFSHIDWEECIFSPAAIFFRAIIAGEAFAVKLMLSQEICQDLAKNKHISLANLSEPTQVVSRVPLISNQEWLQKINPTKTGAQK